MHHRNRAIGDRLADVRAMFALRAECDKQIARFDGAAVHADAVHRAFMHRRHLSQTAQQLAQ